MFNPAVTNAVHFTLKRSPHPLAQEDWTNSLGMAFRWVSNQWISGLWICQTETRVRDFRRFTEAAHYDATAGMYSVTSNGVKQAGFCWTNLGPGFAQTEDCPVVGVNWLDATNFCGWLTGVERTNVQNNGVSGGTHSLSTNQTYRLPSTNEWIRFVGNQQRPQWGDPKKWPGNYAGKEIVKSNWPALWYHITNHYDKYPRTAPVHATEFQTNEYGLYHVGGNAAEWCDEKALCGGSWRSGIVEDVYDLASLRADSVQRTDWRKRQDWQGFRVVISTTDPNQSSK